MPRSKNYLKLTINFLDEVVNIVEKPNVIICKFDQNFRYPNRNINYFNETSSKYFHTIDNNKRITNKFLVVVNNKILKDFIRSGNERVVEARLNDAQFFGIKTSHTI